MAVFCEKTGVRLISPTGDEVADCAGWDRSISRTPVSKDVDQRGWSVQPPPPLPKASESTLEPAPEKEQPNNPAALAASYAPRKGGK